MSWVDEIPPLRPPLPKVELPPPPPPPRRPITYQTWHMIAVAGAALVLGVAVGTVIDVNTTMQPVPTIPSPARP